MSEALYMRIAASLRQRILSGGHPVGDVLPSENELADAYRTSRTTARKAFQVLEGEGLIKPRQGKGYIVQPPRHAVFTLIFGEAGEGGKYRYLGVNILEPDAEVSRMLRLRNGQLVISVRRVLEKDGVPVAFDEKFIPYERGVPSVEVELHFADFPDMFADRFDSMSLRTEMELRAELPPDYVLNTLGRGEERLLTAARLVLASEDQRVGFGRQYMTPEFGPLKAGSGYYGLH